MVAPAAIEQQEIVNDGFPPGWEIGQMIVPDFLEYGEQDVIALANRERPQNAPWRFSSKTEMKSRGYTIWRILPTSLTL